MAGVALGNEHHMVNQRVVHFIPSHDTCLACRQDPSWGCWRGNHTLMFLSLSSLSIPVLINQ